MSPPRYSFFSPRQGHWLWFWPRIALVLFIAAVSGLLWYSAREEREALDCLTAIAEGYGSAR